MIRLAAVLLLMCVAGFAHAGWGRISKDEIRLDGEIGRDSYREYMRVAEGGFSTVSLNSGGGLPLVALNIAEDLVLRQVEIVVDGVCMSACANYLAISGRELAVRCDSVLAWHGTLGSIADEKIKMKTSGVPDELIDVYAAWLGDFQVREDRFFKIAGVNREILNDSVVATAEVSAGLRPSFSFDDVSGEYSFTTVAPIWIPDVSTLRSYGINVSSECGCWTDEEIKESMAKHGIGVPFTSKPVRDK